MLAVNGSTLSASRQKRHERGLWQRRFWEHTIRDEADFATHCDYIHFNPVKHGLAANNAAWPHSTFHRHVDMGIYTHDWGVEIEPLFDGVVCGE